MNRKCADVLRNTNWKVKQLQKIGYSFCLGSGLISDKMLQKTVA